MAIQHLTDADFGSTLEKAALPCLVDFYAEWCGPCKRMGPILEELSEELKDKLLIYKMDVDKNPVIPQKFGIRSVPTMILFSGHDMVETMIGAHSKEDVKNMLYAKGYLR